MAEVHNRVDRELCRPEQLPQTSIDPRQSVVRDQKRRQVPVATFLPPEQVHIRANEACSRSPLDGMKWLRDSLKYLLQQLVGQIGKSHHGGLRDEQV